MDEILCLACNKIIKIPQFVDIDNYDGQLVCSKCKALLHVKLVKGKVQKYKIVEKYKPERTTSMVFVMPDGRRLTPGELAKMKEEKPQIIVQDEETKQLIKRVHERTDKPVE